MNPQQKMLVLALAMSGLFGVLFVLAGVFDAFELPAIVGTISSFTAFSVAVVAIYCGHRSSDEVDSMVIKMRDALMGILRLGSATSLLDDSEAALSNTPSMGLGLLRLVTRGDVRKKLEGDLVEEYNEDIAPEHSKLYAQCWFLMHVLLIAVKRFAKALGETSGLAALFRASFGNGKRNGDEPDD